MGFLRRLFLSNREIRHRHHNLVITARIGHAFYDDGFLVTNMLTRGGDTLVFIVSFIALCSLLAGSALPPCTKMHIKFKVVQPEVLSCPTLQRVALLIFAASEKRKKCAQADDQGLWLVFRDEERMTILCLLLLSKVVESIVVVMCLPCLVVVRGSSRPSSPCSPKFLANKEEFQH